jgi:4a-hydroxytetrahydrobiopterin dehydratase
MNRLRELGDNPIVQGNQMMNMQAAEQLVSKHCVSCEGSVEKYSIDDASKLLEAIPGWKPFDEGRQIRKDWKAADFKLGIAFLNRVAELAEQEGHHPDLHLYDFSRLWNAPERGYCTHQMRPRRPRSRIAKSHLKGYRHVWISLWTHAVGGLSENDFILAAKINELAVAAHLGEWT